MATSSYSNLFGTNGAGQTGSQAGISTMFGQQPKPKTQDQQQPAQTFAQLQQQGMARPAPQAPQGQPFQRFGGSQQAQQARTGMLSQLQQQLAQPTRFDTEAFQKIRQAQSAQLGAEYQGQQSQLNEELARRGLSASSIGGGRMGDLAGQQARALAGLDAQLLQQAAQTQAQDRLAAMQAAGQFADLAGSQDLAQFEANRVAQAAEFQQGLQSAQFGQQQTEFERGQALQAAQAQQAGGFQEMELGLRQALGLGELGLSERRQTAQEQQFAATQAQQAAQFGVTTELERERLAAQQAQFGEQLGFNREELALRGELGRGEQTLAETRLAQEGRLEEARQGIQLKELGQREAQFQSTLGAEEQRFVRTLKEQQDARLQQLGISTRELDIRADQIGKDYERSGQQLTLQGKRDIAEATFRTDQLAQQAALQGRSLDIEQTRNEELAKIQREQLAVEDRLRTEGIAVDRERLAAQEKQFDADIKLRETLGLGELTGKIGEQDTLAAQQQAFNQQQQQNQLFIQLAGILAQSGSTGTAGFLNQLMAALGVPNANINNQQDTTSDDRFMRNRFQPVTTPTGTTSTTPMTTPTTTSPIRRTYG